MRTLIIGGGKVGSYLARELETAGHHVTVIESDLGRATEVGETTNALVLHGDATDIGLLEEADLHRADWVLAVTGRDEDNIVACQLAATLGATRVLARLNNPKNRSTFDALKIPVVAVTDLMVQVISREVEVDVGEAVRVALLGRGQISLHRDRGAGRRRAAEGHRHGAARADDPRIGHAGGRGGRSRALHSHRSRRPGAGGHQRRERVRRAGSAVQGPVRRLD